jgi:hypothetical protein
VGAQVDGWTHLIREIYTKAAAKAAMEWLLFLFQEQDQMQITHYFLFRPEHLDI